MGAMKEGLGAITEDVAKKSMGIPAGAEIVAPDGRAAFIGADGTTL